MSEIEFYLPNGVTYVEPVGSSAVQRYFNPGASITTKVFQKNVSSVTQFNRLQIEKENAFKVFAREFACRYGIRVDVGNVKGSKSLQSKIVSHAGFFRTPSECCDNNEEQAICSIHDGLRARFYVTSESQMSRIAKRLSPAINSNIVDVQDGIMSMNEENGIPRYKVIYDFGGFNVEMQIYHEGMGEALKKTDRDHKRQRAYDDVFGDSSNAVTDWKLASRLARGSKMHHNNRLTVHDEFRRKLKLDKFLVDDEERQFYFNDRDGYFYTSPDPYEAERPLVSLRPDFNRGMYVVDNSKSDFISESDNISKNSFVTGVLNDYQKNKFPRP